MSVSETPPAPPPPAAPRPARRWPRAVLAVVVLLAAAGVGWWQLRTPRTAPPAPPLPPNLTDPEVVAAVEKARQAVLAEPNSAGAWGVLGMVLLAHEFDREADECFATATRLDSADPKWLYARGLIAVKKDPDNALALLRQARTAPGSGDVFKQAAGLLLAEELFERGELNEAEALFAEESARSAKNPRVVFGLGLIAAARGNEPVATQLLTEVRGNPFARRRATARLAVLARARGDLAAARAHEKAVSDLPEDLPWPDQFGQEVIARKVGRRAREKEAAQLEQDGQFAEAAQIYLRQLEAEPSVRAYLGAGKNLTRAGDFDRGLPLLRKAVEAAPDDPATHFALGLMLFVRAEQDWQRQPGAEALKDRFREASRHARRAAELKPAHAQAYLLWGVSLKYLGESAAAVEPLRKGVACQPEDFELQLALGEVLLAVGEWAEARKHLENAVRLDPKDPRPGKALERLPPAKK